MGCTTCLWTLRSVHGWNTLCGSRSAFISLLASLSHMRLAIMLNLEGKSCDLNNQWTVGPGVMASSRYWHFVWRASQKTQYKYGERKEEDLITYKVSFLSLSPCVRSEGQNDAVFTSSYLLQHWQWNNCLIMHKWSSEVFRWLWK